MTDFDKMTRDFLLGEGRAPDPSMMSHIQALEEMLGMFQSRSQSDQRRMEVVRNHLKEMKRSTRRLQMEHDALQEKVNLLEEEKADRQIDEDYK